jgi:hypothetical protein
MWYDIATRTCGRALLLSIFSTIVCLGTSAWANISGPSRGLCAARITRLHIGYSDPGCPQLSCRIMPHTSSSSGMTNSWPILSAASLLEHDRSYLQQPGSKFYTERSNLPVSLLRRDLNETGLATRLLFLEIEQIE